VGESGNSRESDDVCTPAQPARRVPQRTTRAIDVTPQRIERDDRARLARSQSCSVAARASLSFLVDSVSFSSLSTRRRPERFDATDDRPKRVQTMRLAASRISGLMAQT
jgi:hypothetical protein